MQHKGRVINRQLLRSFTIHTRMTGLKRLMDSLLSTLGHPATIRRSGAIALGGGVLGGGSMTVTITMAACGYGAWQDRMRTVPPSACVLDRLEMSALIH